MGSDGLFMALDKPVIVNMIRDSQKKGIRGIDICNDILDKAKTVFDRHHASRLEDDDISLGILFFNQ